MYISQINWRAGLCSSFGPLTSQTQNISLLHERPQGEGQQGLCPPPPTHLDFRISVMFWLFSTLRSFWGRGSENLQICVTSLKNVPYGLLFTTHARDIIFAQQPSLSTVSTSCKNLAYLAYKQKDKKKFQIFQKINMQNTRHIHIRNNISSLDI